MKKTIVCALSTAALFSTVYAGTAFADSYQVQSGDSLSQIASKFHTSVSNLKTLNGLHSDLIYQNQTLKVSTTPPTTTATAQTTYIVVKGDALIKLANRFNVTVGELKLWNNLDNTIIYIGQALKVSAPTTSGTQAPTTIPAAATSSSQSDYSVQSGDCLSKIAVKYSMTVAQLKSLNNLTSDRIYVGQTLKISTSGVPSTSVPTPAPTPNPTPTTNYPVKSGDTLGGIARQFGLTVQQLQSLNNLSSDRIYVGQSLKVTGQAAPTPSQVSSAPSQVAPTPTPTPTTFDETQFVTIAKSLMGIPYVWGGSSLSGFDCSGLIYYVANHAGLSIGRYSAAGYYSRSYYVDTPKPGDLVFFENTYKSGVSHMGIYIGENQFIHADEKHGISIANLSNPYYTTHLDGIKRFY